MPTGSTNLGMVMSEPYGSTRVGALLMREASDSIKRLSLELGGTAVEGVMASKFRNGGQAGHGALMDQVALELRERGEEAEHEAPGGAGRVDAAGQHLEPGFPG